MKKLAVILLIVFVILSLCACDNDEQNNQTICVSKIENIPTDFMMGADVSSLLALEASGRVFYGFDGKEQDLFATLKQSGINYIRVRVWNDPFDDQGNGYGGGNCTVDTAIELGKRAKQHDMDLLVNFHYSDFWADPGKQQSPKAWANFTYEQKLDAIYTYTLQSLQKIQNSGVTIGMVQVGNETTGGFCGETDKAKMYTLMGKAAQAVRDVDKSILVAIHFTNPERKNYVEYANYLKTYNVDYDVFATSYYPEYHGTMQNLVEQLTAVQDVSGKKVMMAETSWAYTSDKIGAYKRSVQGQADEISACIQAMVNIGGIGVFYWEPAWIDVPGSNWEEIQQKREQFGAGWASSFAGSYDTEDAAKYWGGTACIPTSLFTPDGHPHESLKTFLYVRQGAGGNIKNFVQNHSFESADLSMYSITQQNANTVVRKAQDTYDGSNGLHFWSDKTVQFTVEQTVTQLKTDSYTFSLCTQGDTISSDATVTIYAISDGKRYEQTFTLDGWLNWKVPCITNIPCNNGTITIGITVNAPASAWGTIDNWQLMPQ